MTPLRHTLSSRMGRLIHSPTWCKGSLKNTMLCFCALLIIFIAVDSTRRGSITISYLLHPLQPFIWVGVNMDNEVVSEYSLSQTKNQKPDSDLFHADIHISRSSTAISRRLLIGSTAPKCTYNECRGCKARCIAEQVPVDANDPLNSAYHYRCVCHK
eukprot:PITA_10850